MIGLAVGSALIMFAVVFGYLQPRKDRAWDMPYAHLPQVAIDEAHGLVRVEDVRDFTWLSRQDVDLHWIEESYDLNQLNALNLLLEPLEDSNHFAHAMLSFGFGPSKRVVVSVEARREEGESFGLLPGIYRQFEQTYQINTERDAFTWRTLDPESHLYVVPIAAEHEFLKGLFLDMMRKAQGLVDQPQFYHSFRSNCTTALFDHMNARLPRKERYGKEVLFPAQSTALLQR
ncbi:MAG: hypothetical protein ACI8T1_000016 [Verrucomicrobiales bacterium]|jgi:hypothetical protein